MVHFVGAGPGAPDLITLRGARLLREADQVIYAGSLVNPVLLAECREECRILDKIILILALPKMLSLKIIHLMLLFKLTCFP